MRNSAIKYCENMLIITNIISIKTQLSLKYNMEVNKSYFTTKCNYKALSEVYTR